MLAMPVPCRVHRICLKATESGSITLNRTDSEGQCGWAQWRAHTWIVGRHNDVGLLARDGIAAAIARIRFGHLEHIAPFEAAGHILGVRMQVDANANSQPVNRVGKRFSNHSLAQNP